MPTYVVTKSERERTTAISLILDAGDSRLAGSTVSYTAWPERNGFGGLSIGDVRVDEKPGRCPYPYGKAYMTGVFLLRA